METYKKDHEAICGLVNKTRTKNYLHKNYTINDKKNQYEEALWQKKECLQKR